MKFYLVNEAAELLRCSDSLIYDAVAKGRLSVVRLSGKGLRGKIVIPEEALKQFIDQNTTRQPDLSDELL